MKKATRLGQEELAVPQRIGAEEAYFIACYRP